MSTGTYRWGELSAVSDDKGPYKIGSVEVDGKTIDCHLFDLGGMQVNPKKNSLVFVITPDGDEGRAIALVLPRPEDRVDQQKEGELTIKQFKRGQTMQMDDNGNVLVRSSSGIIHLNPP